MSLARGLKAYTERQHGLLGTVADVFGLVGFALACWGLFGEVPQTILAIALALLAFACVAYALFATKDVANLRVDLAGAKERADTVERRWKALDKLDEANTTLTQASVLTRREDAAVEERFIEYLEQVCRNVAEAMAGITRRTCRVTLQETYLDETESLAVRRIVSSSYTTAPAEASSVDRVSENTDFDSIFNGAPYYLCNDLPAELPSGYRNSHWTPELLATWVHTGDYPYRSAMVFPVSGPSDGPSTDQKLIGFLSIDSSDVDVFDADTVGVVGRIVAKGAYASLIHYRAWRKDSQ